ncbi:DUF871 domain-containing protein [Erysipelothrix sp. HDW6C]|uniref:DUF871 domain-containing protein n=1 Tax=Erysipelothrix sp. HDW6C TaxID=2714930 RepID=UPI0014078042|nr:MupG family TIM beta-alpha barrel fold protein [Erysipelothrix sp. HDW6C]QIK70437.1 DUF871 domain-containing protein [Erysipelothrix sp. HDW6C]
MMAIDLEQAMALPEVQDFLKQSQRNINLGVSIYPEHSTPDADKAYLKRAAELGFTKMFTCLLSVGDDVQQIIEEFTDVNGYAQSLGYEVIVDVNPMVFDKLGATREDLRIFKQMNVDTIRLDMGYGVEKDAAMTHNKSGLKIELNASTNESHLAAMIAAGADVHKLSTCHNFYPQKYTGLSEEDFVRFSTGIDALGVSVAGFVSSNAENTYGPWPVYQGLVSMEDLRGLPIDYQARFMIATKKIKSVMIGNAYATDEELVSLSQLDRNVTQIGVIPIDNLSPIEQKILFADPHVCREFAAYMKRDFVSRFTNKGTSVAPNNTVESIQKGDVVIVNDNLKHYAGEISIITRDGIVNDGSYNVVAHIKPEEAKLVEYLQSQDMFQFIK